MIRYNIFGLVLLVVFASCQKEEAIAPTPSCEPTAATYFSGWLGDDFYCWTGESQETYSASACDEDRSYCRKITGLHQQTVSMNEENILVLSHPIDVDDLDALKAAYAKGEHSFASKTHEGFILHYAKTNGQEEETLSTVWGEQLDASLEVEDISAATYEGEDQVFYVTFSVECTLYDTNGLAAAKIRDGKLVTKVVFGH
ncbi:MAG: hypothetical protein GY810_28010 [Aureispira sp.]|nr:hypothetical protein [Aureispira sp.]